MNSDQFLDGQELEALRLEVKRLRAVNERAATLLKATIDFVRENPVGDYTVFFDEAECDGSCLAEDCAIHLEDVLTALGK